MRTTDLDAVAPLYPVGKTAAKVAGRGEHWDSKIIAKRVEQQQMAWSRTPLPTFPAPTAPQFIDLTGQKFGRLTVIGYAGSSSNASGARFVVRCVCGSYSHRTRKALKNPEYAVIAACDECNHVASMRREFSSVKRRA